MSEAQDIQRKQGKETVDALVGAAEAHAKLLKANERCVYHIAVSMAS